MAGQHVIRVDQAAGFSQRATLLDALGRPTAWTGWTGRFQIGATRGVAATTTGAVVIGTAAPKLLEAVTAAASRVHVDDLCGLAMPVPGTGVVGTVTIGAQSVTYTAVDRDEDPDGRPLPSGWLTGASNVPTAAAGATVTGPTDTLVTYSLTQSQTDGLTQSGALYFDVLMVGAGDDRRLLEGSVLVSKKVAVPA